MDNNLNQNPNQPAGVPLDLSNYEERKAKEFIFWTFENGIAFLNIKQFDAAHNETGVERHPFSKIQIKKMRNDIEQANLQDEQAILDIQARIEQRRQNSNGLLATLEKDIEKAEQDAAKQLEQSEKQ